MVSCHQRNVVWSQTDPFSSCGKVAELSQGWVKDELSVESQKFIEWKWRVKMKVVSFHWAKCCVSFGMVAGSQNNPFSFFRNVVELCQGWVKDNLAAESQETDWVKVVRHQWSWTSVVRLSMSGMLFRARPELSSFCPPCVPHYKISRHLLIFICQSLHGL